MNIRDLTFQVGKLELDPGDCLVFKPGRVLTDDEKRSALKITEIVARKYGALALVLDHGDDVTKIAKAPSWKPDERDGLGR